MRAPRTQQRIRRRCGHKSNFIHSPHPLSRSLSHSFNFIPTCMNYKVFAITLLYIKLCTNKWITHECVMMVLLNRIPHSYFIFGRAYSSSTSFTWNANHFPVIQYAIAFGADCVQSGRLHHYINCFLCPRRVGEGGRYMHNQSKRILVTFLFTIVTSHSHTLPPTPATTTTATKTTLHSTHYLFIDRRILSFAPAQAHSIWLSPCACAQHKQTTI